MIAFFSPIDKLFLSEINRLNKRKEADKKLNKIKNNTTAFTFVPSPEINPMIMVKINDKVIFEANTNISLKLAYAHTDA